MGKLDLLSGTGVGAFSAVQRMLRFGAKGINAPTTKPLLTSATSARDKLVGIGQAGKGKPSRLLMGKPAPSANQSRIIATTEALLPGQAGTDVGVAVVGANQAIADAMAKLFE